MSNLSTDKIQLRKIMSTKFRSYERQETEVINYELEAKFI